MNRLIPNSYEMYNRYRSIMINATNGVAAADLPFFPADFAAWQAADAAFLKEYGEATSAGSDQKAASDASLAAFAESKTYTTDYYIVLNRAIIRGEIPAAHRVFYNLDGEDSTAPEMNTEAKIILWGERVAIGEAKRLAAGGPAMAFPTAAAVAAKLAACKAAQKAHGEAQIKTGKERAEIAAPFNLAVTTMMRLFDTLAFKNSGASQGQLNTLQRQYGMEFRVGAGESFEENIALGPNATVEVGSLELIDGLEIEQTTLEGGPAKACRTATGCTDGILLEQGSAIPVTKAALPGTGERLVLTNEGAGNAVVRVRVLG